MKKIFTFSLVIFAIIFASAQTYTELNKFANWGISLSGNLNFKDDSKPDRLSIKNTKSFSVGGFYEFYAQNHWSFIVGLDFNYYDIFDFENNANKSFSENSHCFSVPLLLQYKTRMANKTFLSAKAGLYVDLNRDDNGAIGYNNTGIGGTLVKVNYQADYLNYSFLFGLGAMFDLNYFLLGTDVVFSYYPGSSKTTITYTEGYSDKFSMNGNYLGIKLSFRPKKF